MPMDDDIENVLDRVIDRPPCNFISMETIGEGNMSDSLYNINIRGLRRNLGNLEEFLGQLQHKEHAKAITLTEIFNADHNEKNNFVESHILISACRASNKNRGGVGVLVHETLQFTTPIINQSFMDEIFESITVVINDIKAIVVSIYRPTGGRLSNPKEFNKYLKHFLKDLADIKVYKEYTTYIPVSYTHLTLPTKA